MVNSIRALDDGRAKVFFAMGGNFASATPDTALTEDALRKTRLTVQVSTKLNRSHLVTGRQALILPTLGRSEEDLSGGRQQTVTVEDSMRCVHGSRGRLKPASPDLRSEVRIVCELAQAILPGDRQARTERRSDRLRQQGCDGHLRGSGDPVGPSSRVTMTWSGSESRVMPGFEDFNRRCREPGGFILHPAEDSREFDTANGKAHFTVNPLEVLRVPEGRLLLQTMRSHDQGQTRRSTVSTTATGV